MPSFKFLGFATGSTVALAVAQGALSANAALTWGQAGSGSPNATLSIIRVDGLSNANLIAPAGVMLRASSLSGFNVTEPGGTGNDYDPTQHRITFIWDFGDPGYTPRFTPNIPTVWRNTNVAYGKVVAHVFNAPGNYTVTCYAFDEVGNWGIATYTFQSGGNAGPILNPDTEFATTQTVCYSPANNFTGKPTGAVECTTLLQVRNAVSAAGSKVRFLFRRGETYTGPYASSPSNGIGRNGGGNVFYGAYGTGAAPVVDVTAGGMIWLQDVFGVACSVSDLDLVGSWDAATETGKPGGMFASSGEYAEYLGFHRCRISGMGQINFRSDNTTVRDGFWHFNDCIVTNWKDYGFFGGVRRFAVIGSDFFQHVDALMGIDQLHYGSQSPTGLGNTHGPLRTGIQANVYAGCSSFFSRNGWSTNPSGGNMTTLTQGTWRMTPDTSQSTFRVHQVHERCTHESAGVCLTVQSVGDPVSTGYTRNVLVDKCLFVGSAYGASDNNTASANCMIQFRSPGITVRNSYFYRPNVARRITGNLFAGGIIWNVLTTGSESALSGAPSRFYNITAWMPGPTSNFGSTSFALVNSNGLSDVKQNNVLFAPDLTTPIGASFAPLGSSAIAGFACRFKGGRWNPPPIGSNRGPSGLLPVRNQRENPLIPGTIQVGDVQPGQSILLPYPTYTGTTNHGGYTLTVTQAMMTGNPTQRHQVSISDVVQRRSDPALWPQGEGGVTITFLPSLIRVRNDTGAVWSSGDVWLQLDLTAQLMAFDTASPADVPNPILGAGSAAIRPDRSIGAWAHDGFWTDYRQGVKTPPSGAAQTGKTHNQGALA